MLRIEVRYLRILNDIKNQVFVNQASRVNRKIEYIEYITKKMFAKG